MSQVRYERLSTNSNYQDDEHSTVKAASKLQSDDNDNHEIELNIEHHIKYEDYDDDEENHFNESFRNGRKHSASEGNNLAGRKYSNDYRNPNAPNRVSLANKNQLSGPGGFMQVAIGTLVTILVYLTLSICLTFYQKKLIKELKFPLSIVSYHLVIKFFLAASVRSVYKCRVGKSRVQLDWRTSVKKMGPTGIASGIDIGFSNWGLELVSISLYTMTKSTTIVFILIFAIILGLEKKSWLLMFTVGLIACGLFMFTYKSTQFDSLGFVFLLVASLSSGIRWSFAQFLMQKTKLGLHNPIDMIFHMQPWMILSILPFMMTFEAQNLYNLIVLLPNTPNTVVYMTLFKITFGAVLAFLMEVSEFLVLSKTSGLTLSIAGIFKDVCQLALAVELDDDQLTMINVFGLIVCLAGISCHVLHKYSTMTKANEHLNHTLHYNEEDSNDYDEEHFYEANDHAAGRLYEYNETSIVNNNGSSSANPELNPSVSMQRNHSGQTVPLLEQIDSESDEVDDPNASDVIFDVLKRRDTQR